MAQPIATIVICTYNRAGWLYQCLFSLAPQLQGVAGIEVLVVDNNSSDRTAHMVRELMPKYPFLRYVHEPAQGRSHAKNRGIVEAKAEWIAFLDDDARALPGYIEALISLVRQGQYDIVGGVYIPWYSEGRVGWFRDDYASNVGVATVTGDLAEGRFASAGIMLVRKAVFDQVGGFDPALGRGGGETGYGEETRLQIDVRRVGGRIGLSPNWRIEHLTPCAKQRVRWLISSAWSIGRDSWRAFDRRPGVSALLAVVRRLMTRPVVGLYKELADKSQASNWRTILISVARPLVMTMGELVAGVRLMFGRG